MGSELWGKLLGLLGVRSQYGNPYHLYSQMTLWILNPAHFALAKSPSLQQLPSDQSGFHLRMS